MGYSSTDSNEYYIGYAAAIEDFSRKFYATLTYDIDDGCSKEYLNEKISSILDEMRIRLATEIGMDNRYID